MDKKFELFKEIYFHEMHKRFSIKSSVNSTLTVIIIITGALIYIIQELFLLEFKFDFLTGLLIIILFITILTLLSAYY